MSASASDAALELVPPVTMPTSAPREARRVLLALGIERSPIRALRGAYRFAKAIGAELHVIRVVSATVQLPPPSLNCVARALRDAQRVIAAARHTRKLCDRVLGECLPIKQLSIRVGAFTGQVALRAAEIGATTIAVAPSHRPLNSSVLRLAEQTGCAILIPRGHSSFDTLMAATDLQDKNMPVIRQAAQLARTLGATSIAVHSLVHAPRASPTSPADVESRRHALQRITQRIDASFDAVVVHAPDAAQGILDQARARDVDLIVVGVRSERHQSASPHTTARVIAGARRSVLLAPLRRGATWPELT